MHKFLLSTLLVTCCFAMGNAQTRTTSEFHKAHKNADALFVYRNTMRMYLDFLQISDDPQIHEMVRDIDKMKFLRIPKAEETIDKTIYSKLVSDYEEEDYEQLMNMRSDGTQFNVFIKEKNKITSGLIVLLDNEEDFAILDIVGNVPLDRIADLMKYIRGMEGLNMDFD